MKIPTLTQASADIFSSVETATSVISRHRGDSVSYEGCNEIDVTSFLIYKMINERTDAKAHSDILAERLVIATGGASTFGLWGVVNQTLRAAQWLSTENSVSAGSTWFRICVALSLGVDMQLSEQLTILIRPHLH